MLQINKLRQNPPSISVERDNGLFRLAAAGPWTVRDLGYLEGELKKLRIAGMPQGKLQAEIDITRVEELDTAGAWLLHRLARDLQAKDVTILVRGATEKQRLMLEEVRARSLADWPKQRRESKTLLLMRDAADALASMGRDAVRLTAFLGEVIACFGRMLLRPWRFRWTSFVHHLEHTGLRAAPIVALICALIGAVVFQQGVVQLRPYGADAFAVDMIGTLALREVGILLTAIMVAGRSASAFTAEIGTMKMREEIDAMRSLGIDPIETLVLPRVLALMVAVPALTFLSDMMCLLGGGVMAKLYLNLDWPVYLERLHSAISLSHFFAGMVKAPFVAVIIGLVGCLEGLSVTGSAESVGAGVTIAVVKAIFLVICLDGAFAIFLSASGF